MTKRIIWILAQLFLPLSVVFAGQASNKITDTSTDPFYTDFKFDSAQLLHTNSSIDLSAPRVVFNALGSKKPQSSQAPASGFFLYKLDHSVVPIVVPSNPFSSSNSLAKNSDSNIYGHLFQRLMQHLFIDLAGGIEPNNMLPTYFSPNAELNAYSSSTNSYSKNWFASASALFTHTWKEFAFNAHLGLTHAEASQDLMTLGYASDDIASDFARGLQSAVSFLHENAELSYHANSLFQPFVAGGLLQVVNANNNNNPTASLMSWGLPNSLTDMNLDTNGYKIGGGLSLNYKHYVLRLEQQYFQRGNLYRNNQSMLSFKVNLG